MSVAKPDTVVNRSAKRSPLTRAEIVAAGLELSRREGPAAVTFRALGKELGVVATSVYRHFRDKDELMLALSDEVFREIARDFEPTDDWAADLHRLAQLGREACRRHAFTAAWLGYRNTGGPGDQAVALATLRVLLAAGLTVEQAVHYYMLFTDMVMGLLTIDAMRATLDETARREDDDALAALYANLARAEPRLADLPTLALRVDDEELFRAQIDLYIGEIRRTLTSH